MGFFLCRFGAVKADGAQLLSQLIFYIFMPLMMFSAFTADVTRSALLEKKTYLLWGAVLASVTWVLGRGLSVMLSRDPYEQSVYVYEFLVPNNGFIGYALMDKLYGEEMLLNMVIFCLPLTLYACTGGYRSLCCGSKASLKDVCNPSLLAVVVGFAVAWLELPVPSVLQSIAQTGKSVVAPLGMILVGMVLSEFELKSLLREKRLYFSSAIRLVVLPCMMCLVLLMVHASRQMMVIAVLLYALPAGVNPVIYAKLAGQDCRVGAGMLLLTNAAVLITMPFLIRVFLQ